MATCHLSQRTRTAILAAAALLSSTYSSFADERSFDRTSAWEIALVTPDGGDNPYCEVRSVTWAAKRVSVKIILTGVDQFETNILLQKDGWGMPAGQSTTVGVRQGVGVAFPMNFTVVDPDTLGAVPAADHIDVMATLSIAAVLGGGKAASLTFVFQGDEEPWSVPAMTLYEARQFNGAFAECQNALTAMGPKLFAGQQSQQKQTSPFGQKPAGDSNTPTAPQSSISPPEAQANAPKERGSEAWEFSEGEADWGKTCYMSAKVGAVTVGFMGSPGEDFVGYVDGLFKGDVRATWRVDEGAAHVSDGGQSDYSGWHEFGDLPLTILDEVASGSRLAVTDRNGKRVVVALNGANGAVPAFKQCYGATAPQSAASSGTSATPNDHGKKTFQSCLLEVNSKKVIDGACKWGPYSDDGSSLVMEAQGYFAIVYKESDSRGYGYWNGERNVGHAHADLGNLTKLSDCWSNSKVKICIRD